MMAKTAAISKNSLMAGAAASMPESYQCYVSSSSVEAYCCPAVRQHAGLCLNLADSPHLLQRYVSHCLFTLPKGVFAACIFTHARHLDTWLCPCKMG